VPKLAIEIKGSQLTHKFRRLVDLVDLVGDLVDLVDLVDVRYFTKGIFPRANSQVTIFQVASSQMCNYPSGNFPKVRLDPLKRCRLQLGPSAAARMC